MNKALVRRVILFFLAVVAGFFITAHVVKAVPPANFQTTQIVGAGLDGPSGFGIAPDGRIFILERAGVVKIYKGGQLLPDPFVTLPSVASGDRGLIGIAFDTEFTTNHYIYFYYTGLDLLNRIVRFNAVGDIATDGPVILYETQSPSELLHVGGSLQFGPDGKLYFAVGDNGISSNAQQLGNPHGKILRINKDGTIPSDNPFVDQPGALPEIWAYGLRNPWRFQFDSNTGFLYGGDVGDSTWEEINHITRGANYGWPTCEGTCTTAGMTNPIYAYNHDGESAAVTGGPVYRGTLFPSTYQGRLFFGDYAAGFIKTLTLDAQGNSTGVQDFDLNAGSVVDLKVAPDGSLYYITYYPGRLYRISYSTDNHIPVSNATADVTTGVEPLTVHFSSEGSLDPDGDTITYLWNFGDTATSTDPNPIKTYTERGAYLVELMVSDGTNTAQAVPVTIQVGIAPTLIIGTPAEEALYRAGDTINYSASAVDGVGNDINDASISTEILFHHGTHIHPFLGPLIGRVGSFTIPTTGEASADTWYEIKVTATDSNGLSTTLSVNIRPRKSTMTFVTNPAGMELILDGAPFTSPRSVEGVVGFQRSVGAPLNQMFNGVGYQFQNWSDGGTSTHIITTPETNTTYTVTYEAGLPTCGSVGSGHFIGCYYNNMDLTNPVLTRADPTINFDWGGGSPDPLVNNDNFSAQWTGSFDFNAENYQFTVTADDGFRLFIDNQLVLDKWIDQPPTTYTILRTMTAGSHTVKLEYFENGGGAVAQMLWTQTDEEPQPDPEPTACDEAGTNAFTGCYFNAINLTNLVLTRTDPTIDFDWGNGSPASVVNNDNFSARWTGSFDFNEANYQFTVRADDGVRLYVDNVLVIDQWIDQGATTYTATRFMTQGPHIVTVEYYENGGGAVAEASWVQTGGDPDPDPEPQPTCDQVGTNAFTGCYFNAIDLTNLVLVRTDPTINFDWGGGSPDPLVNNDNFSAQWTGSFDFNAENYQFTVTADDGFRLFIDNQLVLDKWIDQPPTTYTILRTMTAGSHTVKLEYFENGGGAVAQLSWTVVPAVDTTPPVITNIRVLNITSTGATITWATDELSDSRVQYGRTINYGNQKSNSAMVISHTIRITGLRPNTLYHFRVRSRDASGNVRFSDDNTFRTQ